MFLSILLYTSCGLCHSTKTLQIRCRCGSNNKSQEKKCSVKYFFTDSSAYTSTVLCKHAYILYTQVHFNRNTCTPAHSCSYPFSQSCDSSIESWRYTLNVPIKHKNTVKVWSSWLYLWHSCLSVFKTEWCKKEILWKSADRNTSLMSEIRDE